MIYNTIILKKYVDIYTEKAAAAELYPGMLLYLTSADTVAKHNVAGGNVERMFAIEDFLQGKGVDDAYAAGAKVQVGHFIPGENVLAILADGQDIQIGDPLESNGAGFLTKHIPDLEMSDPGVARSQWGNQIVGYALERVDSVNDSSGDDMAPGALSVNKRIKIRVV